MSLEEREKKPNYSSGIELWLIDPETGEKRRWIGDESSGFFEGDKVPQKKDLLPELKAPGGPEDILSSPARINDDS